MVNTLNSAVEIEYIGTAPPTDTEQYWGVHTIRDKAFKTAKESLEDVNLIQRLYPFHASFMNLYTEHKDEVILDYGCGPGRDLVGFLARTKVKKVIGADVSQRALDLSNHRLALHTDFDPSRVSLMKLSDATPILPFEDNSIDYIHCSGVLHHTTYPEKLLAEFYRILKPGKKACIMVYNRNSVWFHLWVGYKRGILDGDLKTKTIEEIWTTYSDCGAPISHTYTGEAFVEICERIRFKAEFLGGYISVSELDVIKMYLTQARKDPRTLPEGLAFLKALVFDENGYPMYEGKYAGIGGSYDLQK